MKATWLYYMIYEHVGELDEQVLRNLHQCSLVKLVFHFLFFVVSLSGFGIQVILALQNAFGSLGNSNYTHWFTKPER